MRRILFAIGAVLMMATFPTYAGITNTYDLVTTTIPGGSETENRVYAGLKWSLEGGATPALVLGVLHAKVDPDGDTDGANLSFDINLAGGVKPGRLKLNYLNGKEDWQGEVGVGFDFLKGAPLLGLGVNGPYVNAGVDAYQGFTFNPFLTIHSRGRFDKPNAGSSSTQCQLAAGLTGQYQDSNCTILAPL